MTMTEKQFEDYLKRYGEAIPPSSPWFADRIINAAARRRQSRLSVTAWLRDMLSAVMPQPAFALATVLTLGIAIGFALPAANGEDNPKPAAFEDAAL